MRWLYGHNALSKEARNDSGIVLRRTCPAGFVGDDRSYVRQLHDCPDRLGFCPTADGNQHESGGECRGLKHHSAFHRVFAAAQWSLDELGLAVFGLILPWLDDGLIMLAVDDTLARKRGRKVYGVGMHHDPLLSTRRTAVMNRGDSWVVLGVIVRFPFCAEKYFCLPILFRLYVNKQTVAKKGGRYRTRPELASRCGGGCAKPIKIGVFTSSRIRPTAARACISSCLRTADLRLASTSTHGCTKLSRFANAGPTADRANEAPDCQRHGGC